MASWFKFNGWSSGDMGLTVTEYPPHLIAEERAEYKKIPGKSGSVTLLQGDAVYEDITLSVGCYLPDLSNLNEVTAWLRGNGDLILGNSSDYLYRARVTNQIKLEKIVRGRSPRAFNVNFRCNPFRYESDPEVIALSGTLTLDNPGTISADPLIMIRGTGQVILTIGDCTVIIDDMANAYPIYIDCDARVAYRGLEQYPVSITLADGAWPQLGLGATKISWIGNAKITITPNWRWL